MSSYRALIWSSRVTQHCASRQRTNAEETTAHTCMLRFERKKATYKYPSPDSYPHLEEPL
jgi:hypothetical protein